MKIVAINGSPNMGKGNTALLLDAFFRGIEDARSSVELFYAKELDIKPCTGEMHCWYTKPGQCYIKDEMQTVYPILWRADIVVIATPVYIPLPGELQNIINRLCPLIEPLLTTIKGRTRALFRKFVKIRKFVLVSTGGWWEKGNFNTVVRIVRELAENAGVEYAGALLRPHAFLMKQKGQLTPEGNRVLEAARKAGYELIKRGKMDKKTLSAVNRPLISRKELMSRYNAVLKKKD
jgi:multimeric flavodoxin WrbA